ncbi:MAG: hypothetical protein V1659_02090, partial [Candidatus Woesearchaeota archaeon]
MKTVRILLACPTFDGKNYCLDFWAEKVLELQKVTPCDVLLVDNSKTENYSEKIKKYGFKVIRSKYHKNNIKSIGEAKKKLNSYLIRNKYDFHFSLEQDIFPDKDVLRKLLDDFNRIKKQEAIVGVPYYLTRISESDKHPFRTLGYVSVVAEGLIYSERYNRKIQKTLTSKELENKKGLIRAFAIGFGCCLIPRQVIEQVTVKYSEDSYASDDTFFYMSCERLKIPVYADIDLMKKVKHIPGSNAPDSNGIFSWGFENSGNNA